MKRELKFRAWTKNKIMQYNIVPFQWDYVINTMWHKCIESNGSGILGSGGTEAKFEVGGFAIREEDIMQYTGLKDKNGKEIYEGDIIKLDDPNWGYGGMYDKEHDGYLYREVAFEDGCFCFKNGSELYNVNGQSEVIGNIYENPELL